MIIYLKKLIDISDIIVVTKTISLSANGNDIDKATARVIRVLKGNCDSIFDFRAHPTWNCDMSRAKMGETSILFLDKTWKKKYFNLMYSGRGRITSKLVSKNRFAILTYGITYPYRIWKNVVNEPIDTMFNETIYEYSAPFDTVVNVIADLIKAPPLLKYNCHFCLKFIIPPNEWEIKDYVKDHKILSDADRIAIFDGIYGKGVSSDAMTFLLGDPDHTTDIDNNYEKWTYEHLSKMIFDKNSKTLFRIDTIK